MEQYIKFLLLSAIFLPFISTRHVQFFRKDYTYVQEFDAFYKIHLDSHGLSWEAAFLACDDEGATLFYPKAKDEWSLVKNLTNEMPEAQNVTDVYVGLYDDFGLGEYMTVDGHATSSPLPTEKAVGSYNPPGGNCILMNTNTGLFKEGPCTAEDQDMPFPYVCKKVESEYCPTIDQGYKYNRSSKKCYKTNNRQKMWNEAMRTCYMEGGILVVIENQAEADAIRDLLKLYSTYYVGVRRRYSGGDYYTVKGQKFDDVYQRKAFYNNLNEPLPEDEDCGAVYLGDNVLSTTTSPCNKSLPFICEMEANV